MDLCQVLWCFGGRRFSDGNIGVGDLVTRILGFWEGGILMTGVFVELR